MTGILYRRGWIRYSMRIVKSCVLRGASYIKTRIWYSIHMMEKQEEKQKINRGIDRTISYDRTWRCCDSRRIGRSGFGMPAFDALQFAGKVRFRGKSVPCEPLPARSGCGCGRGVCKEALRRTWSGVSCFPKRSGINR